jgi:hypothetical protein
MTIMPDPQPPTTTQEAESREKVGEYLPSEGERDFVSALDAKYDRWKRIRRPHEIQWFLNAAFFRGQHYVFWHDRDNRLATPDVPTNRVRLPINRLQAKVRARMAKFLRNRPVPLVIPASTDMQARMDARASTKALEYIWSKARMEAKYRDALMWASETDHGYWWLYWDPTVTGRVSALDPVTQEPQVVEQEIGDVAVEVGSPFEVLVADPAQSNIGLQPEIMRIKVRDVGELRSRYPDKGSLVTADVAVGNGGDPDARYDQRIAFLAPAGAAIGTGAINSEANPTQVVVKEWFERPSARYPKGRFAVIAGGVLLRYQEQLPYEFHDLPNPYPCIDFSDYTQVGQYWGTTILEQLIPIQKEYNLMRSKVAEHLRLMAFPKLLAARQHQIPPGVWTAASGEFVEYLAHPNIPPPQAWNPPNIASDVWRSIDGLKTEFDDVSHVYPEAEGRTGGATSGFQTNLLQEATDQVHAPDIRAHELCIEEAAWKLRRLMKQGYKDTRLITIAGRDLQPEVIEFSAEDIDENAEIRVQAGSALPQLKGARIQSVMELYQAGLLGDPADPEVRRRATTMIELSTIEDAYDYARKDEDEARIENATLEKGAPLHVPEFWENHQIHYRVHTDLLKGSSTHAWPPEKRDLLIQHLIGHVKYQNPMSAIELATQYGHPELVQDLIAKLQAQQVQQAAAPQAGPTHPPSPAPPAGPTPQPQPPGGNFGPRLNPPRA